MTSVLTSISKGCVKVISFAWRRTFGHAKSIARVVDRDVIRGALAADPFRRECALSAFRIFKKRETSVAAFVWSRIRSKDESFGSHRAYMDVLGLLD